MSISEIHVSMLAAADFCLFVCLFSFHLVGVLFYSVCFVVAVVDAAVVVVVPLLVSFFFPSSFFFF